MSCFFEGGMDYHRLRETPLPELLIIHERIEYISRKRKAEINKGK